MTTPRRGGLGRGLGALIPTGPVAPPRPYESRPASPSRDASLAAELDGVPGARLLELPLDAIVPNPRQPRQVFDEGALEELVVSLREVGVLQPVVVREVGAGRYELVMGERRWRAARLAGLEAMPAIVRETADDALLRDALLENLHRQQLNPLEEAAAYAQLLEEFGATHEELATRIGRSRPQISNTIRLLQLPPRVQQRVAAGVLSAGHARALLALPDAAAQEELATRIVAEGLSVRSTEELVATWRAPAGGSAPRPTAPKARNPRLDQVASHLSETLDTRVRVDLGRSKGTVTIEFAGVEDLERILGSLGVPDVPSGG